jgi:hypothetical protein
MHLAIMRHDNLLHFFISDANNMGQHLVLPVTSPYNIQLTCLHHHLLHSS